MKKLLKRLKKQQGISMPEIMAGIAIMSILAGTGVVSAVNQINKARLVATMDEMKAISTALMDYQKDHPGDTLTSTTTLVTQNYLAEGFTVAPDTDMETDWGYDAWGNKYTLIPPSIEADGDYIRGSLESGGADGKIADDPLTLDYKETDDNIKIALEPMIAND
ncbi:MAG: type II secretion system protein [Patescibacteria group bacterium]